MAPRNGQRRTTFTPEQIAWHLFSVGLIGLMLLVLLVSVESLGDPKPSVDGTPIERATAPRIERHDAPTREGGGGHPPAPPRDRGPLIDDALDRRALESAATHPADRRTPWGLQLTSGSIR
jgi:hypothetical protein